MSSYELTISHFNSLLSHISYCISMLHRNTPYPRRDFILQCSIVAAQHRPSSGWRGGATLCSTGQMSRYPPPPIPPLYHTQYYPSYIPHLFSPIHPIVVLFRYLLYHSVVMVHMVPEQVFQYCWVVVCVFHHLFQLWFRHCQTPCLKKYAA